MSREDDYAPIDNLWIRQDQMDKIIIEAQEKSLTIYSLIRKIIDYYFKNKNGV